MEDQRWQRLGDIYHAALETPAVERSNFLHRACPDPTLRVEVEALLAQGTGDGLFDNEVAQRQSLAGTRLGPYQIVKEIGSGGMGVVYQALDTRLDRTVAVKVLPEHIAADDDLRQRFESEARAVASLNHPHICTLHDIGHQGDLGYMVMEFMDGQSLAQRLAQGPLPLKQALSFALQIADALDRAHRAGVTHRDVKPGNIMVTRDGVKLLDFGLARSSLAVSSISHASLENAITAECAVIGTPQYMAPEQFEGRPADARADVWAFGAVLYEMFTGRKAFAGQDYSSLVAAILTDDPLPLSPQPFAPAWLERLTRRCLSKDPEDRYQSMRDVVLELQSPPPEPLPVSRPSRWPWLVAAAATLLAAVAMLSWWWSPPEAVTTATFEVHPPPGTRFGGGRTDTEGSAISPDGRMLAFMATTANGERLLHVRALDTLEARALPGTESAGRPFWAPNSKSLGFAANGKMKRVDIVGGAPVSLCDVLIPRGGTWSENGVILFADLASGLQRIPETGGNPVLVSKANPAAAELSHSNPHFLPGGQQFLFLMGHSDSTKAGIYLGSLDGRPALPIQSSAYNGLYDPSSRRLLYIQSEGTLMARRLHLRAATLSGDPVVLAERVAGVGVNGYGEFSLSRTGTLFYARGPVARKTRFSWRSRTGKLLDSVGPPVEPGDGYALLPDDRQLAYASGVKQPDVWLLSLASGISTRITLGAGVRPRWSHDGKTVYYTNREGIYSKSSDGSGDEALVHKGGPQDFVHSISSDGRHLLFGFTDILQLELPGASSPKPYLQTKHRELSGIFSPDGRWVSYFSDESGRNEVYVQGFPERRGKWLVSTEGGQFPRWRADGKELYWIDGDNRTVMAAMMEFGSTSVKLGRATALFRLEPGVNPFNFQPARDGQRFLTREPEIGEQAELPMVVVQKWAAALRD